MGIDIEALGVIHTEEQQSIEKEVSFITFSEKPTEGTSYQQVSLVDLNMMSGSSEVLRTAIGGYFKNVPRAYAMRYTAMASRQYSVDDLRLTTPPAFVRMDPRAGENINPYVFSITSYSNESINEHLRMTEGETGITSLETGDTEDDSEIYTNRDIGTLLNRNTGLATRYQDTLLPSIKFVVHIEGNPYPYGNNPSVLSDTATGNKFWKTLWMGGEFASEEYAAIYKNATYDDHFIHFPLLYRKAQIKALHPDEDIAKTFTSENHQTDTYLETSFEYNKHLKNYQNFVGALPDEKLIPNYYLMHTIKQHYDYLLENDISIEEASSAAAYKHYKMDTRLMDYCTLSNTIDAETFISYFDDLGTPVYTEGFELEDGTIYESHDQKPFEGYLDTLLPKYYNSVVGEVKDHLRSIQRNILFNHNARNYTKGSGTDMPSAEEGVTSASNQRKLLPYYATIALQTDSLNDFSESDAGAGFEKPGPDKVRSSIEKYDYSTMLLRALKECFLNQSGVKSTLQPTDKKFLVNQTMFERSSAKLTAGNLALTEGFTGLVAGVAPTWSSEGDKYHSGAGGSVGFGYGASAGEAGQSYFDFAEAGEKQPFRNRTISNVANFRTVDFMELIIHNMLNYKNTNLDFICVNSDSVESLAAYDEKGVYRSYNSKNAISLINEIVAQFATDDSAYYLDSSYALFNSTRPNIGAHLGSLSGRNPNSATSSEYEVLAYRVQKSGAQGIIQNFWFWNSHGTEDEDKKNWPFRFVDSQVKYGVNYSYKVYAYYLVTGAKYETSAFQLSRIIGPVYDREFNDDPDTDEKIYDYDTDKIRAYCVEMFDPDTGEATPDLLKLAAYGPSSTYGPGGGFGTGLREDGSAPVDPAFSELLEELEISSHSTEAQRIAISRATSYDYVDTEAEPAPPYMANFIVTAQPSYKVIEVPIEEKTFKIADSPPNIINAVPGYARDNSNKILFELYYQVFNPSEYPVSISAQDSLDKVSYISGKDITMFNHVREYSVSRPSAVQIYRLPEMPKYFSDFDGALRTEIDLKIKDSLSSYTSCVYSDTIKTNTKYYYLFRAVSENSVTGYIDNVLQVELVNDGGYKYPIFKTLFDTDIEEMREENSFGKVSKEFKSVIQLIPADSQITMDDSMVSYENTSTAEYDNIKIGSAVADTIWGKTFKLRLTSKKTGKKIDLNITYNDPSGNLLED
jgi:hypothetical protein